MSDAGYWQAMDMWRQQQEQEEQEWEELIKRGNYEHYRNIEQNPGGVKGSQEPAQQVRELQLPELRGHTERLKAVS